MTAPLNRTWAPGQSGRRLQIALSETRRLGVRSITASTTATLADDVILADATGGAITVTLPAVGNRQKIPLAVKKLDASVNAVTIAASGADTIDGAATLVISTQYACYTLVADANGYWIV